MAVARIAKCVTSHFAVDIPSVFVGLLCTLRGTGVSPGGSLAGLTAAARPAAAGAAAADPAALGSGSAALIYYSKLLSDLFSAGSRNAAFSATFCSEISVVHG